MFFLSCIFLGWNGIQIIFSLGLILTFIDTKSMTRLVVNSMRYNTRAIPIYAFAIVTLFVIHWLIRCFLEASLSAELQEKKLSRHDLWALAINFFVPNMIMVILVFVTIGTFFLTTTFSQIISAGFSAKMNLAVEYSFYRWLYISVIVSIIVTTLLVDNVLPKMIKCHSFKGALYRAFIQIRSNISRFSLFYLIKILLILFTLFIFQSILRHFLLPYFILLEDKHSFTLLLFSSRIINVQHIVSNILIIYGVILSALLIFSPIMAYPYIYQRLLLNKWTNS